MTTARPPFTFDPDEAAKPPWPHQADLISALCGANAHHQRGDRQVCVVATGGGKRRIVNDFLATKVLTEGARFLVVTKDWVLLQQAADDLCRRRESFRSRIGYVGSGGRRHFPGIEANAAKEVVFATIQTWNQRSNREFQDVRFDYVIIDEQHWGEGGASYELLLNAYSESAVFIGATATRRQRSCFRVIGREYGFADLAESGVLAKPHLFPAQLTGITWEPELTSENGDFTPRSLSELASSPARNRLIVRAFLDHREAFGKTIIFACNIDHAKALAVALAESGVRAAALHSRVRASEKVRILDAFRSGESEVLVNVAMATHGVDVQDIRTVFLVRPTHSDILFAQMLGRGSRLAPGKTHFNVVDFVDNVPRHGVPPLRPEGFFGSRLLPRSPRIERHVYLPAEFVVFPLLAGYEDLHGVEFNPQQTFGIEFELDHRSSPQPEFAPIAQKLLEALRLVVPAASDVHDPSLDTKDFSVWNVEPDGSCGWEVTSRILMGESGFREVADACRAISVAAQELGLRVTVRTGTHVHLGWTAGCPALRRLFEIGAYYEPALLSLVAPSRADNRFARSLRGAFRRLARLSDYEAWARHFATGDRRYLAVNPSNLFGGYGTVEVRSHSGTIEAKKILTWTALWMRILDAAANTTVPIPRAARALPMESLASGPTGDVRDLARFVGAGGALADKLAERRHAVVSNSWCHDDLCSDLAHTLLSEWGIAENVHVECVFRPS